MPFLRRQSPQPPASLQTRNNFYPVVKKSISKLAPISIITKKVTPVRKKFPHDFFGAEQRE
jgi:hypothetical protein